MSDDDLDGFLDEQRTLNLKALAASATNPVPGAISAPTMRHRRLYRRDGSFRPQLTPTAYDDPIETVLGRVNSRVFPGGRPAVIAHFHGGGWCLGSIYEQDAMLAALAERSQATVISIDYPLAPETALPRALDVAEAALAGVIAASPGPVCLLGESAGAHIALACVLRLKHTGAIARIAAMALNYGIYDLSMTPSQRMWGDSFLGLSTPWLEWFYTQTLPGSSRDERSDPSLSPLYADLAGLPPALFSVGTADPLLDDSLFLFQRWQTAGNGGDLKIYPEAPHGFNHADTAMARCCNDRVARFLTEALDAALHDGTTA